MFDQFDDIIMYVKELLFLESVGGGYLPVLFVANFFREYVWEKDIDQFLELK